MATQDFFLSRTLTATDLRPGTPIVCNGEPMKIHRIDSPEGMVECAGAAGRVSVSMRELLRFQHDIDPFSPAWKDDDAGH